MAEARQAYQRAWYLANRDKVLARAKARYWTDPKARSDYAKAFCVANKDRISTKKREYYETRRSELIAKQLRRDRTRPERVAAYKKAWHKKNRDRLREQKRAAYLADREANREKRRARYHARPEQYKERARRREALVRERTAEPVDYDRILRKSDGYCGICRRPLDLFGIHFDHVVPLSRGGAHVESNIQVTHAFCNLSKGAKLPAEMNLGG